MSVCNLSRRTQSLCPSAKCIPITFHPRMSMKNKLLKGHKVFRLNEFTKRDPSVEVSDSTLSDTVNLKLPWREQDSDPRISCTMRKRTLEKLI